MFVIIYHNHCAFVQYCETMAPFKQERLELTKKNKLPIIAGNVRGAKIEQIFRWR